MHGSHPVLRREEPAGKAADLERIRRGRYCRQLRETAEISLETMAKRAFRDKSTLSRFENGKTTPTDLDALIAQYEALGDPVEGEARRSGASTDARAALLWVALAVLALVAAVVPDETGTDVIRVGAVASLGMVVLTARALRYGAISTWLGAASIMLFGAGALAAAVRIGEPAQGLRGGDGIVLLISAAAAFMWYRQDVEKRIGVKRADAALAASDTSARLG